MDDSQALIALMDKQIKIYKALVAVLKAEQEGLINRDDAFIEDVLTEEDQIIADLEQSNSERRVLFDRFAKAMGIEPEDCSFQKLFSF